eukprot:513688-Pelagomonas_calceolata.AAC.1
MAYIMLMLFDTRYDLNITLTGDSSAYHRDLNSKECTYHHWCAPPSPLSLSEPSSSAGLSPPPSPAAASSPLSPRQSNHCPLPQHA